MFLSASEDMDKKDVTIAPLVLVKCQTHLKDGEKNQNKENLTSDEPHPQEMSHVGISTNCGGIYVVILALFDWFLLNICVWQ